MKQPDLVRDGRDLMQQEETLRPKIQYQPKHFTLWLDPNEPWERAPDTALPDHPNYRYQSQRVGEEAV